MHSENFVLNSIHGLPLLHSSSTDFFGKWVAVLFPDGDGDTLIRSRSIIEPPFSEIVSSGDKGFMYVYEFIDIHISLPFHCRGGEGYDRETPSYEV